MASAPLFAALAMRTLDRQEPARPRRRRFRWLAVRQDPKAPMLESLERTRMSARAPSLTD